jgi:transposase
MGLIFSLDSKNLEEDSIIIADKGFYSKDNIKELEEEKLK